MSRHEVSAAEASALAARSAAAAGSRIFPRMQNHSTAAPTVAAPEAPPAALIDIGINLGHDSYDPDRDAVLARARAAGVAQMLVTGATLAGSAGAIALARAHPGVLFATAGVHPHHASELTPERLPELEELARASEVVAFGECGLDYFRDFSPREAQRQAFHRQLELAARLGKPLFLHQRDAHADFVAILREHAVRHTGVAHCFTGDGAALNAYLELGLLPRNPFEVVDAGGVGELVELGTERGRSSRPDLKVGVCGEHGGDPVSIDLFYRAGLDYVSCSPFRVPVARLAAAQAVLAAGPRQGAGSGQAPKRSPRAKAG